jgi:hypothetical protein
MEGFRFDGGEDISANALLLYQAVTPGEPEGNGRSCLIGETKEGPGPGVLARLVVDGRGTSWELREGQSGIVG